MTSFARQQPPSPLNAGERLSLKQSLSVAPFKGKNIQLRLVNENDAVFIFALRNDPNKGLHLSKGAASVDAQADYIRKTQSLDDQFYFIIETLTGEALGTVRIYDLKPDSFCWGSWIIVDHRPSGTAIESALLIYEFGFYVLGYRHVHFDVRRDNTKVIDFHARLGAKMTHCDDLDCFFVYEQSVYEEIKHSYRDYLPETMR